MAAATTRAPTGEDLSWRRGTEPGGPTARGPNGRTRTRGGGRGGREGAQAAAVPAAKATPPPQPAPSINAPNAGDSAHTRARGGRRAPARGPKPAITIETPAPVDTAAPASAAPASARPSRRKRGQGEGRNKAGDVGDSTPTSVAPASGPEADSPQALSVSASDATPPPADDAKKDVPPHLRPIPENAPAPDAKPSVEPPAVAIEHKVDTLVEHMRAVAMARPLSPGSHIDWAGDEDDSLPDLNDWGYSSQQQTLEPAQLPADIISPILQDSLKALPVFGTALSPVVAKTAQLPASEASVLAPKDAAHAPAHEKSVEAEKETAPAGRPEGLERTKSRRGSRAKASRKEADGAKAAAPEPRSVPETIPEARSPPQPEPAAAASDTSTPNPLHPSLPARPVNSPKPASLPAKPLFAEAISELTASVTAPSLLDRLTPAKDAEPMESGLRASIHAPRPDTLSASQSAPDQASLHSPGGGRGTSSRAQPKPPAHRDGGPRAPSGRPTSAYTAARGVAGNGAGHTRTQSTPVTPGRSHRSAVRPVLTGAAISSIMKTLQNSPARSVSPARL
jgi:hypothetical protein